MQWYQISRGGNFFDFYRLSVNNDGMDGVNILYSYDSFMKIAKNV